MSFAIRRSAADQRSRSGCEPRIYHVNIKRHRISAGCFRGNSDRILDALEHSTFVDVAHRKEIVSKPKVVNKAPFAGVEIACAYMGAVFKFDLWGKAFEIGRASCRERVQGGGVG